MNNFKIGEHVIAIFPDGTIEGGVIIKKYGRLALDEGLGHIHYLDGGFPDGTEFESVENVTCDAEEEAFVDEELEGTE